MKEKLPTTAVVSMHSLLDTQPGKFDFLSTIKYSVSVKLCRHPFNTFRVSFHSRRNSDHKNTSRDTSYILGIGIPIFYICYITVGCQLPSMKQREITRDVHYFIHI